MSTSLARSRIVSIGTVLSLVAAMLPLMFLGVPAQAVSSTLVINEIDYDQDSTDTAEFLEIKNVSDGAIELDPYAVVLVNGSNGTVYATIDLPMVSLAAGDYFVVCGDASIVPNCDLDVSPNTNLIQNGAPDAVAVVLGGVIVDTVSYEGDTSGYTEGSGAGLTDSTALGQGISRCPDGGDTDQNNMDLTLVPITPGASSDCPGPPPDFGVCGDPATLIHEVQGTGLTSLRVGDSVVLEAVVVGDFQDNGQPDDGDLNGFHLQEEDVDVDLDQATSEGVFVFAPGAVDVAVGQLVRVQGTVTEFSSGGSSMTELSSIINLADCGSGPLPLAAIVDFPVPATDHLERFEGMSTVFAQDLVISEYFNYDRFVEVVLSLPFPGEDRLHQPSAVVEPGPAAVALREQILLRRITLDDGLSVQNPSITRHPNGAEFTLTNRFRGGDIVTDVVGVIDHTFGLYRIHPTDGADYTAANPRPAAPDAVGGELTVSSFNVLNYFLTIDAGSDICGPAQDQECRGADSGQEFDRQRVKILTALDVIDADVFGLIEMENTTGVAPLADIVTGLNAMGAGPYEFIDTGTIGTDAIKVGIIYQPGSVTPLGAHVILDSSVDPRFDDSLNRPVLAQSFEDADGGVFTVAVNHLKSKGSACDGDPDVGDGQGNCNQTRTMAARAQVDWLATDPTGSGDSDVLIIGDLNAYDKEDPIDAIRQGPDDTLATSDDYTDLILQYQGELAYSFVFDGLVGYLDHALSNAPLTPQVSGATIWHINADEPDLLDYDTTFKSVEQAALFESNAYRSSDHDPVIVGLDVNAPPSCDTALADPARLWPANHKFVPIAIDGVTDPDGDDIAILVDSIFQDEAVDANGSGNTAPDGRGLGTDTPEVRAERVGSGNGRVYHIGFTATDDSGLSCSGEVQVEVPGSRHGSVVDDGSLFDSTASP